MWHKNNERRVEENKMIHIAEPSLIGNEKKYVLDCLETKWISSKGKYVSFFEEKFSKFCATKYGTSCSNGTVALHLAFEAINLKPGDEVIMPNLTFISPANAARYCGAKPVFIDSEKDTWNIDPGKIEEKITEKTKAIVPVHLYGHPADMKRIMNIARKHNLRVIEDCAEAHGAEVDEKKVGSLGDIGTFSFYGNKIATTGEGGICVTNNSELFERMKLLKNHGMSETKKYWHDIVGYNYRMTNIQAAIGLAQTENIDKFIQKRIDNAKIYNQELSGLGDIVLPPKKEWARNVYWMYSILFGKNRTERDNLIKTLEKAGIESRPFFYLITEMPPYKTNETFEFAEKISSTGINLPSSYTLTQEQIMQVCKVIKKNVR